VINHKLDAHAKTVVGGTKASPFLQTEWAAYNYRDTAFRRALYSPQNIRSFRIRNTSAARAKLLYNLESKSTACKELISNIPGKTIIFGNSLEALESIAPKRVVSSNNTDAVNKTIREDFDEGRSNLIASFKKLKQGANLVGLDNVVIHSYYSKSKDLIQRIGRLRQNGEIGRVFIFVTFGTQECKWFDMMFEDTSSLNIISSNNVTECIAKLK
jgi:superfamily II DNA or RNA helicase